MFSMMNQRLPRRNDQWSLAEAVDLPLALENERFSPSREADLEEARREIGEQLDLSTSEPDRDALALRAWLRRWQRKSKVNTPGEWIEDVLRNAGRFALVAGVLLGLGAASDRLFFSGGEPLNVFFLIGVFVLAPLLLSATLFLTVALRRPERGNVVQQFFIFVARKLTRAARDWGASDSLQADPSWTTITKSLGNNGNLLQAPILAVSQKLALGFGIGLLIMLHLRVSFWELAFGWQTTLTAPGELWHLVTKVLAAPWSWFWPEGSPTLGQINATRFSRLPGAPPIDAAASRAWWPFLFATILVWSVLLRLGVLAGLRAMQARRLRAFNPALPDAQLLVRRLRPHWGITPEALEAGEVAAAPASNAERGSGSGSWIALVADESDSTMPRCEDLPHMLGLPLPRAVPFQFDDSVSETTLAALEEIRRGAPSVVVLVPVSRDPIDEVADTLHAIASAANGRGATLLLCGARDRLAVWKRKLDAWATGLAAEYVPKP
jgi:hypothetical protein